MRRAALYLLTLSLLAFGCEVGALCSMAQATEASCCCPLMEATERTGGGDVPPCMEGSSDIPAPADSEATLDGSSQASMLSHAMDLSAPQDVCRTFHPPAENDPAAGHGPAIYLLACSWLN
ncbi:MAG: hypothetical protein MPN21_12925 [Thermoanaerobaculia bacterium]|nr:hypothetical protein [Thermoanaerobaculia bacterium]